MGDYLGELAGRAEGGDEGCGAEGGQDRDRAEDRGEAGGLKGGPAAAKATKFARFSMVARAVIDWGRRPAGVHRVNRVVIVAARTGVAKPTRKSAARSGR